MGQRCIIDELLYVEHLAHGSKKCRFLNIHRPGAGNRGEGESGGIKDDICSQ